MAAGDLTSLTNVRSFLQKPVGDTDQDALISSLITRASAAIMRWTGREFAPASTGVTRTFTYEGNGQLDFEHYDLRSVTSATIDSDLASPITLLTTDYSLQPTTSFDGLYTYLELPNFKVTDRPGIRTRRQVSITGNWGFAAVPADVEHWCIVTVVTWLRRDVAAFSTTFSLDEERVERPEALPSAVRAGLRPYKRIAVA